MPPFSAPQSSPFGTSASGGPAPGIGHSAQYTLPTKDMFLVDSKTTTTTERTYQAPDGRLTVRTFSTMKFEPTPMPDQQQNGHAHFQSQFNGHNFGSSNQHHQQTAEQILSMSSDARLHQPFTPEGSYPAQYPAHHASSAPVSRPFPTFPSLFESTSLGIPSNQPIWPSLPSTSHEEASGAFFGFDGMQGMSVNQGPDAYVADPTQFVAEPFHPAHGVELQSQSPCTLSDTASTPTASSSHLFVQSQTDSEDAASTQQALLLARSFEQHDYHKLSEHSPRSSISSDAGQDVSLIGSQMRENIEYIQLYEDDEDCNGEHTRNKSAGDDEMEQVYPASSGFKYDGYASTYEGHTPEPYYAEAGAHSIDTASVSQHYGSWSTPCRSSSPSGQSWFDAPAPSPGFSGGQDPSFSMPQDLERELFGYASAAPTPSS